MESAVKRLGPYEILNKLGAGGMGDVYRARDTRLDRDVAIKVLPSRFANDPQATARFQREMKAVAAFSHSNIRAIFDVGCEQGVTYAVMELLEGETLGNRIRKGALDWSSVVAIGIAIAEGLAVAHAKGVTHRDIKPDNIFLTAESVVKILDFGLVRVDTISAISPEEIPATIVQETQPGTILGTVQYMSPEQVRGRPADARSDVFSLGCVLYEMTSGRRAFASDTNADTIAAILHQTAPVLTESDPGRPPELNRVIARCLEKDPNHRYASGREVAEALKALGSQFTAGGRLVPDSGVRGPSDSAVRTVTDTAMRNETSAAWAAPSSVDSVAVLPFVNLSSDKENEYFSDGLAEELIAVLTRIEGLRVASRTSSFAFKAKNEDVRRIGEQLNVRRVLEGSVRKSGNRIRISVQLVNVEDGYQLWSETYNRQLEDVFEIQDEISQSISKALRLIFSKSVQSAAAQVPTGSMEAYDCYLRGRQFFHQFRRRGYQFAVQMFRRAIEIDPNYARAYAGLADCHSMLYTYWVATSEMLQAADAASLKARELAPDLAEVHVARGLYEALCKHYEEAEVEYQTAIRIDPHLFEARYFFGRMCLAQGRLADAAGHFEAACRLRPDDFQAAGHLGSIYVGLGRKEEALAASRYSLQVIEKHIGLNPDDARALYLGAVTQCQLGNTQRGLDWAGRALAIDPEEPVTLYNVACVYALQGKLETALDCLEASLQFGFGHKEWIEHDSDLDALRSLPRYQALLLKL